MKRYFLLFAACMPALLSGQQPSDSVKTWKTGGAGSITFSQVSLTNWAAGGANSLSANAFVSLFANYKKGNSNLDNTLDIAYGLLNQKGQGTRKSDDRLEFAMKYGQHAFKHWFYSGLLSFKTQMTDGYNYPNDSVVISRFMAPAYLLVALGMDYKPSDNFTLFISPLTGKNTFVLDNTLSTAGAFGVKEKEKYRAEMGGYLKMMFKTPVMTNVDLVTKLDLFSNYMDKPQNIDVSWEVLVTMKINKYLSANLNTMMIYDDDIKISNDEGVQSPRLQFKEVFGVGLSYKF
jgi:hypothetical protein